MACKLNTRRSGDGAEGLLAEYEFDQPRITIGRGPGNDVVFKDPTRMVSTKHAEIRAGDPSWVLVDVGSTNGTTLNGTRITAKQPYALHDGDCIAVGPFQLVFRDVQPAASPAAVAQPARSVPVVAGTPSSPDARKVLYLLRRALADPEPLCGTGLEGHVDDILRRALQGLDRESARGLLHAVKRSLSTSPEPLDAPPERRDSPPSLPPVGKPERSPDSSGGLAGIILEHLNQRGASYEPDRMGRQIARILDTVCAGLADAVRGRREFQKEFEVESTRILAWAPNPLKHAEHAAEIGSVLLTPDAHGLTDDQAIGHLREVFQDLALHQLGLMAGFRECVRGLLKELDPAILSKPGRGEKSGKGLGLLAGGTQRSEAAAWHRFLEKHRQLIEEEVRVFEQILAPHFSKGYLSIQQSRRRP